MLALLYPHATGDVVTVTAAQMEEVERCKSLKRAAKATAGQLAESEQTIKSWMGEAPAAYHEGRKVVTWGSVNPKARKVQGKRLAEELPDVFAEYSYLPESYRRFEVK
jgi:predicted phage-related endonuclease